MNRVRSALKFSALTPALALVGLLASSSLTSCWPTAWKSNPQPGILVILIENLGFNSFSCGDSSSTPEDVLFEGFCNDSVRFTHAYAPSPMSQPAIASVLTGLYPREHGVRHNGPSALSAQFVTVPEVAKAQGFKTSFFSGGPPIFRRSGFNQGFDLFDDSVPVSLKRLYKPASDIVDLFLKWQSGTAKSGKFLSFLFFPDPQFIDQPTVNELGEVRENSYRSQVMEVSESLDHLVREMKRRKIWDTTHVVLIGVNGFVSDSRNGEPGAVNLFFESTRSTLMVKPARKMREAPFSWKIDTNVSLVDVGTTLFELMGRGAEIHNQSRLASVSLTSAMISPEPKWDANRRIVVESAWPAWRGAGGVRSALRRGPYFYLFDENDQIYNTLTDSREVSPLLMAEPSVARLRDDFASNLRNESYVPWRARAPATIAKTLLGQELWRERQVLPDISQRLKVLSRRYPADRELLGWRANLALQNGDWVELKNVAGDERPVWTYVAEMNAASLKPAKAQSRSAKKDAVTPLTDVCMRALFLYEGPLSKNCGDGLARDLSLWSNESLDMAIRNRAMESYLKAALAKTLTDRLARANMVAGDVWDVSKGRWPEPALSDLMLALPEMKKYRSTIRAAVSSQSR